MLLPHRIAPHRYASDTDGAQRVFTEFWNLYGAQLTSAEGYLLGVMEHSGSYAEAYRPWCRALTDLIHGVYLAARRIPLPNVKAVREAMRIFSMKSAANMLRDAIVGACVPLAAGWAARFCENMAALAGAFRVLARGRELAR